MTCPKCNHASVRKCKTAECLHCNALTDMVAVVKSHDDGARLTGGESAKSVAQKWLEAVVAPEVAETYIEVGSWDAERAGQLVRAGVKASDLADEDVVAEVIKQRDWKSRQRGGSGYSAEDMYDSLAYMHSNNDVSTAEIAAAVNATYQLGVAPVGTP